MKRNRIGNVKERVAQRTFVVVLREKRLCYKRMLQVGGFFYW